MGLEVLYARPGPKDRLEDVAKRDLTGELRERYWIREAADAGIEAKSWANFGISMPWWIEREEVGRNRNEPGDGFRYVFRSGTGGTGGRFEWFEVTEEFGGVDPKDIESFMRVENGIEFDAGFDPKRFLSGLNLGIPCRAAQRRAADKVIDAVEKKLSKSSYEGMWRDYGYGTLIVGLPLWFATDPLDPLRVEHVIDDFMTRIQIGLEPYARQLRRKSCAFWRIVVVWKGSVESIREWTRKARLDVYEDPSYHRIGSLPIKGGLLPQLLELAEGSTHARANGEGFGGVTRHVAVARPEKKEKSRHLKLPPGVAELRRHLDKLAETHRDGLWARVKSRAGLRFLEVVCFVRVQGIGGLERWVLARLSPRRRVGYLGMRWRARRLYRASRQRDKKRRRSSGGALGLERRGMRAGCHGDGVEAPARPPVTGSGSTCSSPGGSPRSGRGGGRRGPRGGTPRCSARR